MSLSSVRRVRLRSGPRSPVLIWKRLSLVSRVRERQGSYIFFMESPAAEYFTKKYCDLTMVGGLLNMRGYGIGMQNGK